MSVYEYGIYEQQQQKNLLEDCFMYTQYLDTDIIHIL